MFLEYLTPERIVGVISLVTVLVVGYRMIKKPMRIDNREDIGRLGIHGTAFYLAVVLFILFVISNPYETPSSYYVYQMEKWWKYVVYKVIEWIGL